MVNSRGSLDLDALADSSRCPVCGARLSAPRCGTCGADLSSPVAASVWSLSQRVLTLLDERDGLVLSLRRAAEADREAAARQGLARAAGAFRAAPPAVVPAVVPAVAPPVVPELRAPRLGVQGVLVGLGALLLSVAALVFLAFSWSVLGLAGRALVVAGVTAAALAAAAVLRPRLEATGEALGALGAVLVLADVWAVRSTGLFGADDAPALTYWGVALVVVAAALTLLALRRGVRAGSVTAAVVGPLGVLLLGLATGGPTPGPTATGAGLLAVAAVCAVRGVLPARWGLERALLTGIAALATAALPLAAAAAAAADHPDAAVGLLAAGALTAGLNAAADHPGRLSAAWALVAGAVAALAAGLAGWRLVDATGAPTSLLLVAPAVLAAVALLAVTAAGGRLARLRVAPTAAATGAFVVTVAGLLGHVVLIGLAALLPVATAAARPWRSGPGTSVAAAVRPLDPTAADPLTTALVGAACGGLAAAALLLLVTAAVAARRPAAGLREVLRWSGAPLLAVAVAGLPVLPAAPLAASVTGLAVLAVGATVARLRPAATPQRGPADSATVARVRPAATPQRGPADVVLRLVAAGAGAAAVVISWNVAGLSVPFTLLGALALLAARPAHGPRVRPWLVGAAVLAVVVAAGGAAGLLGLALADRVTVAGLTGCLLVLLLVALPAALPATLPFGAAAPDRAERVAGTRAGLVAVWSAVAAAQVGGGGAAPAEPGRAALTAGALALALVAARALRGPLMRPWLVWPAVVAALVATGSLARALGLSLADALTVTGLVACLLAAVLARPLPGLAAAERAAGSLAAFVGAGLAVLAAVSDGPAGQPVGLRALLAGALALAVAAAALAPLGDVTPAVAGRLRTARCALAAAVAPLVAWTGTLVAQAVAPDVPVAPRLTLAAVAAGGAAVLAALVTLRPRTVRDPRRVPVEGGLLVVGAAALLLSGDLDTLWVVLLVLGVGTSVTALLPDRRRVGWGGFALLTASSWLRLRIADVDVVESYTLPPAAVLLAVALLRLRRDPQVPAARVLAPVAGVAIAPSVLAVVAGGALRPALLLVVAAALLAAGAARHRAAAFLALAGAATAAGTGAVRLGSVLSRAAADGVTPLPASAVEVWSLPAAALLVGAAVLLAVRHPARTAREASGLVLVPGAAMLTAPTWAAAALSPDGRGPRLAAAAAVLAVLALVAAARPLRAGAAPRPADHLLTWPLAVASAAGAAVVAVTALSSLGLPVDAATVGCGALVTALGGLRMAVLPQLRSQRALGAGLALLLGPSVLLASGGALWRVLGVVVVAAAVVVVGAVRRLAAPVVVGGAALAAHGLIQVAPYVAALTSSSWRWVVFAAAGAALLTLGATYERRLAQLRAARTAIRALR